MNLFHLSEGYALSIFVINLKSKISQSVKLFHPKILTHALNLVKKMEHIIYNALKKSFIPYNRHTQPSYTSSNT